MVTYEHMCKACEHEWEEVYGMTEDPPTICPLCGVDGKVKRLVSGGSGPGIMRKNTREIKASLADETKAMKRRAKTDEKFLANLVGEDNYNQRVLNTESLKNDLEKIGKKASAVRPKIKTSINKKKKK